MVRCLLFQSTLCLFYFAVSADFHLHLQWRNYLCVGFSESEMVSLALDVGQGLLYYIDKIKGTIAEITTSGQRRRKLFSDPSRHPRAIFVDSVNRWKMVHIIK